MEASEYFTDNKLIPFHTDSFHYKEIYMIMDNYANEKNKQLLDEIDMLKFQLKAADSVNEQLTENQIPEYLIEFIDDVKLMIKLYNNSSHTRSEEYRDKLAEKLDDIRTIDLKP